MKPSHFHLDTECKLNAYEVLKILCPYNLSPVPRRLPQILLIKISRKLANILPRYFQFVLNLDRSPIKCLKKASYGKQ